MSAGPALYLGQVGSTGRSTGPHSHKEVLDLRTGKRIPLSQARGDLGQRIQFRLPGSQEWQQLYRQSGPGQFQLNPAAPMTSPKGMRTHPVTGQEAYHHGEDYGLPSGTDLRFLGSGAVEGLANYGNAGNVARLRTGDNRYQLDVFHLNKLPGAAKAGDSTVPAAPTLPSSTEQNPNEARVLDLFASLFGLKSKEEKPKETISSVLAGSLLQQAMAQKSGGTGVESLIGKANPYSQFLLSPDMLEDFS